MSWIVQNLWLIPAFPLLAAGLTAVARQRNRVFAMSLAIGSMGGSLLLSLSAFIHVLGLIGRGAAAREFFNFRWFEFGTEWVKLGWVLDPLTAVMLVMVTFVGLLIFIYSVGYMAADENFTRFFCFLSLFAAAMLGLVIANSLLLLFICWELVGLTSYLLIGFWYQKPSGAAAAKKAFITTRIGDLAFLLGIVWLYSQAGTLLFYDAGAGCIERSALLRLIAQSTSIGMAASTAIALLIFCGAAGKSGQLPLHVWLPDAMEGPTPVSALIHAATMVAAGVFLIARVYPLMSIHLTSMHLRNALDATTALRVVTWVGACTAIFAAAVAVAQNDIKRILAYSTISQLGYMMMGLGVGGVAVGMFHLITHAFFKALLFLGAGSVIHGCHEEQDIRRMGGIRKLMPVTFTTYAIGMLALSGFPLFFSGFWSKDEILHAASLWSVSRIPFYLGICGSLLTAFYMTRQVCYVFFGESRLNRANADSTPHQTGAAEHPVGRTPHESPAAMTTPLIVLAVGTLLLSIIGTPAWPWFHGFLAGETTALNFSGHLEAGFLPIMLGSTLVVFIGLGIGWWLYGRTKTEPTEADPLELAQPHIFRWLQNGCYIDAFYRATLIRFNTRCSAVAHWGDERIWSGAVQAISYGVVWLSKLDSGIDNQVVNRGFDEGCARVADGGWIVSRLQSGMSQNYLRLAAAGIVALIIFLMWGG